MHAPKKWKRSVNVPFTKSLNISEHHIIFRRWTAADNDVNKPSSHLPWNLVTRWSWNRGCHHFLSFVFGVNAHFIFGFIVFYLWVNSNTHWQLDLAYWVVPKSMSGIMASVSWQEIVTDKFGKICNFYQSMCNFYRDQSILLDTGSLGLS